MLQDQTDMELVLTYRKTGSKQAFTEIYARYGHLVLGLCIKYLKNRDDAKDATLSIFGKLLDDLNKHPELHFKSWLYVYSKNYCLMQLRKRQSTLKRELDLQENELVFMDFDSARHLEEKELGLKRLENAISSLNKEQQCCIELFYLKEKSYKEIAEQTGYSANEVKSHIQNGKRNLKLYLQKDENEY